MVSYINPCEVTETDAVKLKAQRGSGRTEQRAEPGAKDRGREGRRRWPEREGESRPCSVDAVASGSLCWAFPGFFVVIPRQGRQLNLFSEKFQVLVVFSYLGVQVSFSLLISMSWSRISKYSLVWEWEILLLSFQSHFGLRSAQFSTTSFHLVLWM